MLLLQIGRTANEKKNNFTRSEKRFEKELGNHETLAVIKLVVIKLQEFMVVHYAGPVTYDASNFLEKNNDSLFGNLSQTMSNSANKIVKVCFRKVITENSIQREFIDLIIT